MRLRRRCSQTDCSAPGSALVPPPLPRPIRPPIAPRCATPHTPILGLMRAVTTSPRCQRLGTFAKNPRDFLGGLPHLFGLHLRQAVPAKGDERSCRCWWLRDTCHGTDLRSPSTRGKSQRSPSAAAGGSAGRERATKASNPVFNRSHRVLGRVSPKALHAVLLGKEQGYS